MILGIDPGLSGAIVGMTEDGSIVESMLMPTYKTGKSSRVNAQAVAGWIAHSQREITHAYIELVGAMPGQGVSSMFSFGHAAGVIEGVIAALGIPITHVTPQAWKKSHGLIGKDKDAARTRAAQLYPGERVFDKKAQGQAVADAVFIARYGSGIGS